MLLKNYSSTSDYDEIFDYIEGAVSFYALEPLISFVLLLLMALVSVSILITLILIAVKTSATARSLRNIEEDSAETKKYLSYIVYRIDKDRQEKQADNQETKSTP